MIPYNPAVRGYSLGGLGRTEVEVVGRVHPGDDVSAAASAAYVRRLAVDLHTVRARYNLGRPGTDTG